MPPKGPVCQELENKKQKSLAICIPEIPFKEEGQPRGL
jgi:hypothetical protein